MDRQDAGAPRSEPADELDRLARTAVDTDLTVRRAPGPGLLESVDETCLAFELRKRGLMVKRQVSVPIRYGDDYLDGGFQRDLLVEGRLAVELKAVETLLPVHTAQVLT